MRRGRDASGVELHLAARELHLAPIEALHERRHVDGDQVGDVLLHRLFGRNRGRLAHGLLGPGDVATPKLREAADIGDGVVERLFVHARLLGLGLAALVLFLFRFLGPVAAARIGHAADAHRRGRADVGRRRHGGDVRGEQDVGAGTGGARAARCHVHHHRHGRGEDVLDDGAHGGIEPAGRVYLENHERGVGILGLGEAAVHVVRGRRADGAVDLHKHRLPWHSRFLGRQEQRPGREQKQQWKKPAPHTLHLSREQRKTCDSRFLTLCSL